MRREKDIIYFIITIILGVFLGLTLCWSIISNLQSEIKIKDEFIQIQRIVIEKYNNHSGG